MGNSQEYKVTKIQICCHRTVCVPQYEITFQDLDCKSRATPSPTVRQEYLKSLVIAQESQLSSQDTSRLQKLEQISNFAQKLKIRIISSSALKANTEYELLSTGYSQGFRRIKDGFCYFGAKKNLYVAGNKTTANDIVFPLDNSITDQHRGQHFCIYYEIAKDSYFIKDFALGFGTFVRVKDLVQVKDNFLLFIGEHYFLFNLLEDGIKVKIFGPNGDERAFEFREEEYQENCVKIGRGEFCEIVLSDSLVSKVHCCVSFSEQWVLVDGDGERGSTNGVWVYLSEPLEIENGMVFKANHTVFQTTLFK